MNLINFEELNLNDLGFWLLVLMVPVVSALYFFYVGCVLRSQMGYEKSKWEKRRKNEKKAKDRKDRAMREKEAREIETQLRSWKREAILPSQSGLDKTVNFDYDCDAPDWTSDLFGSCWASLCDIFKDFKFSWTDIEFPDFEKYWYLFKESEIFVEFYHLLQMMITLGFLNKIDISFKNYQVFVSEPLRQRVSVVQLFEKIVSFGKLLMAKIYLVFETGNVEMLFQTEAKNSYDQEFTFIKSQKTCIDLGRKAEIDDETYDRRVHECIETTLTFLNTCNQGERAYYAHRLAVLREIQTSRTLSKKEGIRVKPYGMLVCGDSGVGKSAIANPLVRYVLQTNEFDFSPRAVTSLNMEDKFQSEFATHHQGVIFDDICNTSLDRTDGSPALPVIMFLNNMTMAALNANAEMKGKVMIEPKVVLATTNVKDLMSNQLSNEPLSINRRFEVTITQKVRPEYCKEGTEMLDSDKIEHMKKDQFPDFALFTVEEPYYKNAKTGDKFKSGKTRSIAFRPRIFEGKPLIDVDIKTLLRFLKEDSARHFEHQSSFVQTQLEMTDMPLCECGMPMELCTDCVLDSQAGIPAYSEVVEYLAALEIRVVAWINAFMLSLISSRIGTALVAYLMRDKLKAIVYNSIGYYIMFVAITLAYDAFVFIHGAWAVVLATLAYLLYITARVYLVRRRVIKKFTSIPLPSAYIREMSWGSKMKFVYFLMSIGIWKVLVALARKWKTLPVAQAARPITIKPDAKDYQMETEFWDTQSRENAYKFGNAGITEKSSTISMKNFIPFIGNRLMVLQKDDGVYSNALPVRSNVILIPNHMVTSKTEYVTLTKVGGHRFENLPLDKNVTKRVEGTDLAVWYCPGAGLHRDLVPYFPKDIHEGKKLSVTTVFNDGERVVHYPEMTATRGSVVTSAGGWFSGLKYYFPAETFGGLCMATLVGNVDGKPFLSGFHAAGRGHRGAACFATREQIETTIGDLDTLPGIMVSHSATPMNTQAMGIEFGPLREPHEKCVTRDLPLNARIRVHGAHKFDPSFNRKSAVTTSLISSNVEEIMNIPRMHGRPFEMGSRVHREVDIAAKIDTATKFDTVTYQKAYTDFALQLVKIPKSELAKVGKISLDVNLAGLDGVVGINPLNAKTAIGFPGKGPATTVITKSDRVVEGISCPRDVEPFILEEIERMKDMLRRGESINTVFKGSLKDEPTKLTKKKVRVFAAANKPFVMLVREYFLSIAALVQRNKIITECAVGVVVQSPEWTELYEHIGKHGWDRAIAGDYAKFDGRMSALFMSGAFKLLIDIAERSGNYDEDDLIIMRGIASEITYPTYDFFGTLLQFFGSNPSGHPLTVVINSFVNSLYMRYVYYAIAQKKKWWKIPPFASVVSLMTYGDDNIMTVKKGYDDYNHTAIANELAEVGITYTMADKEAESVPFINLKDASFLKHFAVWDDELGLYRSPVEEASIAKMLHAHLESDVLTMQQSSAEAVQNVALKYFEFGRDVYDTRRKQLEEVADVAGIRPIVGDIMTYDERLQWYREKFDLE